MEDKLLLKLARRHGTPLYVYDGELIKDRYNRFSSAFKQLKPRICYAYKANTSLAICSLLRKIGAGADCVSIGEVLTALKVGVNPKDIMYTSNSKTKEELSTALEAGVNITHDNTDELETLAEIAEAKGREARVSFRVNPDINPKTHPKIATGFRGSKFGLHFENDLAFKAYERALKLKKVNVAGVHCHIGSQIMETEPFVEAAKKMMEFAVRLKRELGLKLEFTDLGGGLGLPYKGGGLEPETLAKAVTPEIREGFRSLGYEPAIVFEPGRYLVGESGVLLTTVNSVKETPYKKFVNVDCGFNTLMRPVMYDSYHQVRVLGKKGAGETYDIAGNVCESGDILARDRKLPKVMKGDTIAVMDAGAYGMSMASTYNSRPMPAEVLVRGGKTDLIRERWTQEDLYLRQSIPADLE